MSSSGLKYITEVNVMDLERLSRESMRWYFKQMGNERPSWQKEALKEGLGEILAAIQDGDAKVKEEVEKKYNVHLPKPGEKDYYLDRHPKPLVPLPTKDGAPDDDAWLEGLTHEEREALRKAESRRRGMEKRKCVNCGNYARSKCDYSCCKKCCVEKNNPCKIHVIPAVEHVPRVAHIVKPTARYQDDTKTAHLQGKREKKLRDLREIVEYYQKDVASTIEWRQELYRQTLEAEEEEAAEALQRYIRNAELMKELMKPEINLVELDKLPSLDRTIVEEESSADGSQSIVSAEVQEEFGKLLQRVEQATDRDALERCATDYVKRTGYRWMKDPLHDTKRHKSLPSMQQEEMVPMLEDPSTTFRTIQVLGGDQIVSSVISRRGRDLSMETL